MKTLLSSCLFFLVACTTPPSSEDGGRIDAGTTSQDAGSPMDAGYGAIPIQQYCETRAQAICRRHLRCQRLSQALLNECLEKESSTCDQRAYSLSIQEGRMQYQESAAGECFNAYTEGSCEGTPEVCGGVFKGLVAPPGNCLLSHECHAEGFCDVYSGTCPFKCEAYRKIGEECDGWQAKCVPEVSTCQTVAGGKRLCQTPKGVGEKCAYDECGPNLYCVNSLCVKRTSVLGEPCGQVGIFPVCGNDAFCRQGPPLADGGLPPGTCQRRSGLGGACVGYGACLPHLRCSTQVGTGTCIPLAQEGSLCTSNSDCANELFCNSQTAKCTPFPKEGGNCSTTGSYYQCASGHYCDIGTNYVCSTKKALGETCSYASMCDSNACEGSFLEDGGFFQSCVLSCSARQEGVF